MDADNGTMTYRRRLAIALPTVLCFLTFALGFAGWSEFHRDTTGSPLWGHILYNTLLAFLGDGSYIPKAVDGAAANPLIQAARFTGLAATISALLAIVATFLGDALTRVLAGFRQGHAVVVGVTDFAVDHAAHAGRTTAFDTSEKLERQSAVGSGRRVLRIPDGMRAHTASGWSLGRPARVVFGEKDSMTNVERARAWLGAVKANRRKNTRLTLRVEDKSVARDLHLLTPDLAHTSLISRSETIARSLVTGMAPTSLATTRGQDRVHVVLVGLGSVNLAFAEEIVLRCHDPSQRAPALTIVDRDPAGSEARLRVQRPDLLNPDFGAGGPCIRFFGMDVLECCAAGVADALFEIEMQTPLTAIVVSTGEDTRNLGIAMRLRQLQVERLRLRAPIYMRHNLLPHVAPEKTSDLTGGIVRFGGRFLDEADNALERLHQDLARRVHETWRSAPDVEQNPDNEWQTLSETARRASYRAALSVIELFYAAGLAPAPGAALAGLRIAPAAANAVLGDTELVERLTMAEHSRWCAERRTEGYRHAPVRDAERKHHPYIVPFADLPADQREKDKRNVKEALIFSIQLHEDEPRHTCWRMVLRIGVIGPLAIETANLRPALDAILEHRANAAAYDLEILTPNAPGFDRVAAADLASCWSARTGRAVRILAMNAASPATMDRIALEHLVSKGFAESAASARVDRQATALESLREKGHTLRQMDMRPLGVSDAELLQDRAAYLANIVLTQQWILDLADEMIFGGRGETDNWTQRAMQGWRDRGREPIVVR